MCGRFSLTTQEDQIERLFNLETDKGMYIPRYNGAPTQNLAVISNKEPGKLNFFRWGLVPYWAKDPRIGAKLINARSETILEKPAFKSAFRKRRCLIPSDGFFEWKKTKLEKIPFRFLMKDDSVFAFAGIWEEWKDAEDRALRTFSILTTGPNSLMAEVHDRMPVILRREDYQNYLQADAEDIIELLQPYPEELMRKYPVSSLVNSAVNDVPEVLLPLDEKEGKLF